PARSPVVTKSLYGVSAPAGHCYESDFALVFGFAVLFESVVVVVELGSLLGAVLFDRFEGPEYKSDSQPPPFRMKPPPPIIRRALFFPHFGHFFSGFSVMRCWRSNSWPQASQA
ncbi:MAG: hypothetical protein WBN70_03225, partial [Polyangiales bacterium]